MWMCTSFGMFMPALRRWDDQPEPGDNRVLQIRARRGNDLDMLREKYMPNLGPTIHTPLRDYNYRAYCSKEEFAYGLYKIALDIDYVKFKETAETVYGDKALHETYLDIWHATTRLGKPFEGAPPWHLNYGIGVDEWDWDYSPKRNYHNTRDAKGRFTKKESITESA